MKTADSKVLIFDNPREAFAAIERAKRASKKDYSFRFGTGEHGRYSTLHGLSYIQRRRHICDAWQTKCVDGKWRVHVWFAPRRRAR